MNLRQKTISGLTWSFVDNFAKQGIVFIIGIILARLLAPREFGLIGMTTIFITLAESLFDSGFGQALVRKKNCTQADYATVFYYNMCLGVFLYLILFLSAGTISSFFNEPKLELILQVLGFGLIINSFTLIHVILLIKRIDFKLQTKITVLASIGSGIVGVYMAYNGFGVWSLVAKMLFGFAFTSMLLWSWSPWKPSFEFSLHSFKEMFSFGSKLLISGLLDKVYNNIYLLVIGKYFSATELGFYTRADQFKNLPSQNIMVVIQRVSYPALSSIQDDIPRLKQAYKKLIKGTMFITFFLMLGLAAIAKPLVLVLIGAKWLPSVIYLQLLCFVGIFFPLKAINQNMLKVQGLSGIVLKLEIIKKIVAIPLIFIGIFYGIKFLIMGMIFHSSIAFLLDSYYSGRLIGYSTLHQIKDTFSSFIIAAFIASIVFATGIWLNTSDIITLLLELVIFIFLSILILEIFKVSDYLLIKNIIIEKLITIKNHKK